MSSARRRGEMKVHGRHACRALFFHRPDDVVRIYIAEELIGPFGDILSASAKRKLAYKVVAPEELEALTESKHHEGICLVVRLHPPLPLEDVVHQPGPGWLVALAEVGNPHNLGAILRIAAHFGARGAIVAGAGLSPAAYRVAQGGAEVVPVITVPDLAEALDVCRRARYVVCATSSHEDDGRDLYGQPLPARAVIVFGSEGEGVPQSLLHSADVTLVIPGTGDVESLNVASAASVVLGELWRQHHRAPPPAKRKDTRRA